MALFFSMTLNQMIRVEWQAEPSAVPLWVWMTDTQLRLGVELSSVTESGVGAGSGDPESSPSYTPPLTPSDAPYVLENPSHMQIPSCSCSRGLIRHSSTPRAGLYLPQLKFSLSLKHSRQRSFGSRAFTAAAFTLWNMLPSEICDPPSQKAAEMSHAH